MIEGGPTGREITREDERALGNSSRPAESRLSYLKGNGAPLKPRTFLEKMLGVYEPLEEEPQFPDGTQQHQLRMMVEASRIKSGDF